MQRVSFNSRRRSCSTRRFRASSWAGPESFFSKTIYGALPPNINLKQGAEKMAKPDERPARRIQDDESERKKIAHAQSPKGMRETLDATKRAVHVHNKAALDRLVESAKWTDERGNLRVAVGPNAGAEALNAGDLLLKSNRRSIMAIHRACLRADKIVDDLIDLLRIAPRAMPEDLAGYMQKVVAALPGLDTIEIEIVREPKDGAKGAVKG
jgi:hypothetical protein